MPEPDPPEPPEPPDGLSAPASDLTRLRPLTPGSDSAPDLRAKLDEPPDGSVARLSSQRLSETVSSDTGSGDNADARSRSKACRCACELISAHLAELSLVMPCGSNINHFGYFSGKQYPAKQLGNISYYLLAQVFGFLCIYRSLSLEIEFICVHGVPIELNCAHQQQCFTVRLFYLRHRREDTSRSHVSP